MSPRAQVYLLSLILILIGTGFIGYKSQVLSLPIIPGTYQTIWTVEAKIEFQAQDEPVKVSLALPKTQTNMEVIDEVFSSSGYGFAIESDATHQRATWTKREASGSQALYYKVDVHHNTEQLQQVQAPPLDKLTPPDWSGDRLAPLRNAAESLISHSWSVSADSDSFTTQLIQSLRNADNKDAQLILKILSDKNAVDIAMNLLTMAEIPTHIVRGIYLEDDRSRIYPETLLEIYNGENWVSYNPATGNKGLPDNFLIWQRGDKSLLDVVGGRNSKVVFSTLANDIPTRDVAIKQLGDAQVSLIDYSIYSLPIEQQSIFKFILLVPVGALVVIFLRVVIGIPTAGTFMPVLLAIAFVQTELLGGLLIFLLILATGLWVRSYLSRLDLLLVARIAAVVVIVVVLMSVISIISYKLGIEQALTVTFFPMIIIAWTIEHMSILWEDDGPSEVLIQTTGSLVVAIACYLLMTNRYIEHWMFNFPESLFLLLGLIIMLGQYTGYRVSELIRFRHISSGS